jgi:hypothetical protein
MEVADADRAGQVTHLRQAACHRDAGIPGSPASPPGPARAHPGPGPGLPGWMVPASEGYLQLTAARGLLTGLAGPSSAGST